MRPSSSRCLMGRNATFLPLGHRLARLTIVERDRSGNHTERFAADPRQHSAQRALAVLDAVVQQKTRRPGPASWAWLERRSGTVDDYALPSRNRPGSPAVITPRTSRDGMKL
jgi:hypothetical protein